MARILVVDDQPAILKTIEAILTQRGHVVVTALDARDALEKIGTMPFDLIVTDNVMPGGVSGLDLVKTLRTGDLRSTLPIVLLTGRREKRDVERAIEAGVDDYVVKPVDPDLFSAKIESLLMKKTPGGLATFSEVTISENAALTTNLRIIAVSELGLSLKSQQPIAVGTKPELVSPFFTKVGIAPPNLRVTSCEALPSEPPSWRIKVQFIGLTEKSLQPLRLYIRGLSQAS